MDRPASETGARPFVVGLGGTLRADSSTERVLRHCLDAVEQRGGRTALFSGEQINLPMYNPHDPARTPQAKALVEALRAADAVIVGSPGVAINSADKIWDDTGALIDTGVQGQLDMLAAQVLTSAEPIATA
ncbi:NAD(P)H-dependent oxidoreductase [Nocardia speluncae]|uniref:NAD(P)H-dependent oxidoreductase n=2 Tax=Nocardia speluncae TaxID=419477 RepID=A0A846XCN4_9NOCA|nr:NAD(P)H-dependent oxidoreductase [Nocardia speluncae]